MFEEMLALLAQPDGYVCVWRNGELYIEPVKTHTLADEAMRSCDSAARVKDADGAKLAA